MFGVRMIFMRSGLWCERKAQQRDCLYASLQIRHPERSGSRILRGAESKDPETFRFTNTAGPFSTRTLVISPQLYREKGPYCIGNRETFGVLRLRAAELRVAP